MATTEVLVQNMLLTELQRLQQKDVSLDHFRQRADNKTVKMTANGKVTFTHKKGILYRHAKKGSNQLKQPVVPESRRTKGLKLAHEGLLGAHMGITMTRDLVSRSFIGGNSWPC